MQEVRPEYVNYSATWVEWSLIIGGFASLLLMFTLASKFVTIIPVSEMKGYKEYFLKNNKEKES
jgi:molybdopterin-containing oxidoreductase family membrane subunit